MTGKSIIAALLIAAAHGPAMAENFEIEFGEDGVRFRIEGDERGDRRAERSPPGDAYAEEGGYGSDAGPAPALTLVTLYWSAERGDNFTVATDRGYDDANRADYLNVRSEACILRDPEPGTTPLDLYWSHDRRDNFTTATAAGARDAMSAGYSFVRTQGHVYASRQPGTVPLNLYWDADRQDNFTVATERGVRDARNAGYRFIRVEGYVHPGSEC